MVRQFVLENNHFKICALVLVSFLFLFLFLSYNLRIICIFLISLLFSLLILFYANFFYFSSIDNWKDPVSVLEQNSGAAWKLIFKLLARGRLYDNEKEKPLQITGNGIVRENKLLFYDTYDE